MPATANITQSPVAEAPFASSALKVLLYYDLFRYPLTAAEIRYHCRVQHGNEQQITDCLHALQEQQYIYQYEGFYLLKDEPHLVQRRKKGNELAHRMLLKAADRSALIARFPYVRSVCVSGSLSKDYFDETTDIDFFIITAPGRLWVCRSLLILYKKLLLLNSKKYFCVNYFIDSESLEIPDKNIFTATELITLLPFYNHALYAEFFSANPWVMQYYPNAGLRNGHVVKEKESLFKKGMESLLNSALGEWLDRYFYKATVRHWKKKFPGLDAVEFEVNMRSRKDVSKHHPQGFQFRVLKHYRENCEAFEAKHGISLQ